MALTAHIAPYLKIDAPRTSKPFIAVAQCPALPKKISAQNAQTEPFYSTYRLVRSRSSQKPHPFGAQEGAPRVSALAIGEVYSRKLFQFPVIFNNDRELHEAVDWGALAADVPEKPVFGNGRNVLYLDGHFAFETTLKFLDGFK